MRRKKPLAEIFAESRERHRKIEEKENIIKAFQRAKRQKEYYETVAKPRNRKRYWLNKEKEQQEREKKITELKQIAFKAYICK